MPQKGFAFLPLIIIALIVGGGAFWFMSNQGIFPIQSPISIPQKVEKKPCTLPPHKRVFNTKVYYEGPLIDSHVHMPTSAKIVSSIAGKHGLELPVLEWDLSADNLICLFESQGIKQIFGFHITSKFAEGSAVSAAKAIEEAYPGKVVHFLMPPPVKFLNIAPSGIADILNNNKGLFKGFGEIALYMDSYEGTKPDDPDLKEIYNR